ncbi:hypothetical protein [Marinoscillum sp.]|uniref:hypothetical protein n=1 Tax=Marinoscillum sp. TaxID=2024838 RepID=UPI003BA8FBCC
MNQVNLSYRLLRRVVGLLGIALPIILIIGHGAIERAISYYYYTSMSTVFTGVLISFGLVLFTYRGPELAGEKVSENLLTTLGGVFALIVALLPTQYGKPIDAIFYVHNDALRGWIHNGAAVLFIFLTGLVVLIKFTKAPFYRSLYRFLGWMVMLGLAFTIGAFLYKKVTGYPLFNGAVFWGESFALWAFGIAWLRRGIPARASVKA